MQMLAQPNTPLSTDNPRGGINVHFNLASDQALQQSPIWTAAGRGLCFMRLSSGASLALPPGENLVKVILGRLENIDRSCLAPPFSVRSTAVAASELVAGVEGALFALVTVAADAPRQVSDIAQLTFTGEGSDCLAWQSFEEKFAGRIDYFDGKDCHMANGFHLLDETGEEIVYVNPWACGQGVDLSTHNHAHAPSDLAPAFAEVHWVLAAAARDSGMYQTAEPGAEERIRHPMGLGDEHGPFYERDGDGRPRFRDNGAVQYPWHGWQGGTDNEPGQSYDFVAAFEINPQFIEACRIDNPR